MGKLSSHSRTILRSIAILGALVLVSGSILVPDWSGDSGITVALGSGTDIFVEDPKEDELEPNGLLALLIAVLVRIWNF